MKLEKFFSKLTMLSALTILFLLSSLPMAFANVKQIKAYKEAFPDTKPKCVHCHVDEKPKKEDGAHEWNDYGKKVKELAVAAKKESADADTYKEAGPIKE